MTNDYPPSRDPLDILIAREAKTCTGCSNEIIAILWGTTTRVCSLRKKHGKRCKSYIERGADDPVHKR